MDTIDAMRTFTRVAQRQGFARAARELRVSPGTVTKQVAALERRLSTRLFDRKRSAIHILMGASPVA